MFYMLLYKQPFFIYDKYFSMIIHGNLSYFLLFPAQTVFSQPPAARLSHSPSPANPCSQFPGPRSRSALIIPRLSSQSKRPQGGAAGSRYKVPSLRSLLLPSDKCNSVTWASPLKELLPSLASLCGRGGGCLSTPRPRGSHNWPKA